ncbi:recombinase RecT [Thalassoglobus neptunius]|nr:recombinase RecT [Thalassoglobus neptunius]
MNQKIEELGALTPAGQNASKLANVLIKEVRGNPKLLECTWESIYRSAQESAALGLATNGVLGHAYLVPYRDRKNGVTEAQLQIGYRGYLDLARRHSKILIKTRCVYKGDVFEYAEGDEDFIRHIPNQSADAEFEEKDVTHVYLIAKDMVERDHVICRLVWTRAQVERHKTKYSKSYQKNDSPWQTAWETMARKTLVHQAVARGELPISTAVTELAVREEISESLHVEPAQHSRRIADVVQQVKRDVEQDEVIDITPEDRGENLELPESEEPFEREFTASDSEVQEHPEEPVQDFSQEGLYPDTSESPAKWEFRAIKGIKSVSSLDELGAWSDAAHSLKKEGFLNAGGLNRIVQRIHEMADKIGATED